MTRTKAMTEAEVYAVRQELNPRWQRIFDIALFTGWRVGDVLCLRTDKLDNRKISVFAQKTGKRQEATLPMRLLKAVREDAGQFWAFPSPRDACKPMTREAAFKALKTACGKAGVSAYSPHSLRKTFARRMLAEGRSVKAVQNALGHLKPETTLAYLYDIDG